MDRFQLRNKFLKSSPNENKLACKTQKNYFLTLVRKAKKDYLNNLDQKNVTENKSFLEIY